jgi:hypothetical protein
MAGSRPLWRAVFDAGERAVGGPLETIVRDDLFFDALALTTRLRRTVAARNERLSRRALHLVNLPAGSDMRRLNEQITRLDRHVRALTHELEDRRAPDLRAVG